VAARRIASIEQWGFVSKVTDWVDCARAKHLQLRADQGREFKQIASDLQFGLSFERHKSEGVGLPQGAN
jgi:hypothetical protein